MILLPTLKFITNHHLFPRWPTDPTSPAVARELELAEYWRFSSLPVGAEASYAASKAIADEV
jgi:hypothetical protein